VKLISAINKITGADGRSVSASGETRTDHPSKSSRDRSYAMSKIIVSYDGTANEDDAIALGRIFARAGGAVLVAYVRHAHELDSEREAQIQTEAEQVVERGAALLGGSEVARHIVTDPSTPEGLRSLAEREGADVIVFCSDSHTAKGHVAVGNSAERLLEGGRTAIAIAPAGLAESSHDATVQQIVAVGGGDGGRGARATADDLARALGATVEPVVDENTDLLVIDSRPEASPGTVSLSASAGHLVEIATCSVLVVPRGVTLSFGARAAAVTA
jgi:nucleotide-binding universal stress UspA family protein